MPQNELQLSCLTFKQAVFSSVWSRRLCFCCGSGIRSAAFRSVVAARVYLLVCCCCFILYLYCSIEWYCWLCLRIMFSGHNSDLTHNLFWMVGNKFWKNQIAWRWSPHLHKPNSWHQKLKVKIGPLWQKWVMSTARLLIFFIQSLEIFVAHLMKNEEHDKNQKSWEFILDTLCHFFTDRISLVSSEFRLRPRWKTLLSAWQLTLRSLPASPGGELPRSLCGQEEAFSSLCSVY